MLFSSFEFIYLFLPVTLSLFYVASKWKLVKLCKGILLLASLFFYGYWKASYFLLIILSILVNYGLAVILERYPKKWLLILGLGFDLGLLFYFKYLMFAFSIVDQWLPGVRVTLSITIPLGISFYTFQQITYLIDVYQKKTKTFSLTDYSLFVTFFPQLIAGPILHYQQIMPQLARARIYVLRYRNLFQGLFYFLAGLFQKVVIADSLAPIADTGFANAHLLPLLESWSTLLAYAFQLYFDFSGYSNMAMGLGLFFNLNIPKNFNSPYQASSLIDFWRRWHITLSQFLRDYVYIPLGGNRLGPSQSSINLFLTMLIGGIWHGAGWTFIIWGIYHGVLLVLNHRFRTHPIKIPHFFARTTTFLVVLYGWVFFRAANFEEARALSAGLIGYHGLGFRDTYFLWSHQAFLILIAGGMALFAPNTHEWVKRVKPNTQWGAVFVIIFFTCLTCLNRESAFLYFQF